MRDTELYDNYKCPICKTYTESITKMCECCEREFSND